MYHNNKGLEFIGKRRFYVKGTTSDLKISKDFSNSSPEEIWNIRSVLVELNASSSNAYYELELLMNDDRIWVIDLEYLTNANITNFLSVGGSTSVESQRATRALPDELFAQNFDLIVGIWSGTHNGTIEMRVVIDVYKRKAKYVP